MDSNIPVGVRKGAWTEEEDILLRKCIQKYGEGKWHLVPLRAGLNRCRKSCRLRWLNYLRPNINRGDFAHDEADLIVRLHKLLGNRWSLIAGRLPGRTANDVKNYWNTRLGKKNFTTRHESKGCASEISDNKIVKPQPRTFSKKVSWSRQKTTNLNETETKTKETLKEPSSSPSPSLSWPPPTLDDDVMKVWESLFADCNEILDGGNSWSSLSVSEEEHMKGLWSEEISPTVMMKDDNNLLQEKESDFNDVSIDVDIWDLLRSE